MADVETGAIYDEFPGPAGLHLYVNQRYVAAQEMAERFGARLYVMAVPAGVQYAHNTVVIGDGAEWIWNLTAHHYLEAIEIVDYWHACEHVCDFARIYDGRPGSTASAGPTNITQAQGRWAWLACYAL